MATLTLRALGVSYLLEGLATSGLDAESLYRQLDQAYGPAVGRMAPSRPGLPLDALILDHRADSWPDLLDRIADWVRDQGFPTASWDAEADPARATLELEDD